MVVDIQGVGDLYTDPQIHTASGDRFGEGNLGVRGMALFFSSHVCNSLCEWLRLKKFSLSVIESRRLNEAMEAGLSMNAGGMTADSNSTNSTSGDAAGSGKRGTGSKRHQSWMRHATVLQVGLMFGLLCHSVVKSLR